MTEPSENEVYGAKLIAPEVVEVTGTDWEMTECCSEYFVVNVR